MILNVIKQMFLWHHATALEHQNVKHSFKTIIFMFIYNCKNKLLNKRAVMFSKMFIRFKENKVLYKELFFLEIL